MNSAIGYLENTLKALVSNSEKNKQSRQLLESKVHSSLDYYANTFMKVTVDWLESNTMQLLVGVQSFCPMLYFAIQHQDYKTFLLVILLVNLFQNSAFKTKRLRRLLSTLLSSTESLKGSGLLYVVCDLFSMLKFISKTRFKQNCTANIHIQLAHCEKLQYLGLVTGHPIGYGVDLLNKVAQLNQQSLFVDKK